MLKATITYNFIVQSNTLIFNYKLQSISDVLIIKKLNNIFIKNLTEEI